MAAKLQPPMILPWFVSSTAARAADARGRRPRPLDPHSDPCGYPAWGSLVGVQHPTVSAGNHEIRHREQPAPARP